MMEYCKSIVFLVLFPMANPVFPVVSWDEPKANLSNENKALAEELNSRVARDQAARMRLTDWSRKNGSQGDSNLPSAKKEEFQRMLKELEAIDQDNTNWLKKMVEIHGWPGKTKVGKEASEAAWLLVQHADADPRFQRRCLDLMAKLPGGEIKPSNLALLTDRVLLAEGKKQLYGSQFISREGKWLPRPIEDEANVDERRKKMGLQPLAEYAKALEELYGKP